MSLSVEPELLFESVRPVAGAQRNILIVEDNEDITFFLTHWLRKRGVKTTSSAFGKEALEIIADAKFIGVTYHGLIADYRLPDATGCRVVRQFLEEFPDSAAAIMTAYHDLSLEIWVHSRRIPLFRKPLELNQVMSWVEATGCSAEAS